MASGLATPQRRRPDASVIPINEVEAIEHQQLAIVGQREFRGWDAGFPGGAQAQIFVGREFWIGWSGGFYDRRWHGHRGAIGNHDLGLHTGDPGTRAQIGADQLGKDLGLKGRFSSSALEIGGAGAVGGCSGSL